LEKSETLFAMIAVVAEIRRVEMPARSRRFPGTWRRPPARGSDDTPRSASRPLGLRAPPHCTTEPTGLKFRVRGRTAKPARRQSTACPFNSPISFLGESTLARIRSFGERTRLNIWGSFGSRSGGKPDNATVDRIRKACHQCRDHASEFCRRFRAVPSPTKKPVGCLQKLESNRRGYACTDRLDQWPDGQPAAPHSSCVKPRRLSFDSEVALASH
jgi:hypothetical protein